MMEAGTAGGKPGGSKSRRTQSAPPMGDLGDTSNPLRQGSFGAGESGEDRKVARRTTIASMKANVLAGNLSMKQDNEQAQAAEENEKVWLPTAFDENDTLPS